MMDRNWEVVIVEGKVAKKGNKVIIKLKNKKEYFLKYPNSGGSPIDYVGKDVCVDGDLVGDTITIENIQEIDYFYV